MITESAGRQLLPGMSHKLNVICAHYGIALDHRQADSDSRACAEYMQRGADVSSLIRTYRLN